MCCVARDYYASSFMVCVLDRRSRIQEVCPLAARWPRFAIWSLHLREGLRSQKFEAGSDSIVQVRYCLPLQVFCVVLEWRVVLA